MIVNSNSNFYDRIAFASTSSIEDSLKFQEKTQIDGVQESLEKGKPIEAPDFEKVKESIKKIFSKINETVAEDTTKRIFEIQGSLEQGKAMAITASDSLPYDLIVTNQTIHAIIKKIGEGSYSTVYESQMIVTRKMQINSLDYSPSKPTSTALKKGKKKNTTFSPEKRLLSKAMKSKSEGLDYPLVTFKDVNSIGYSINQLYDSDLTKAKFYLMDVASILQSLISCAKGLELLHDADLIHRDIKALNILVSVPKQAKSNEDNQMSLSVKLNEMAVLSDFGMLQQQKSESHNTCGTPLYLDPFMFGTEEMSILNQKLRIGKQTKEGDIFAFGMTIYRDILIKFLIAKATENKLDNEVIDILKEIEMNKKIGIFNDDQLKEMGKNSRFRIMHDIGKDNKDCLYIFPPVSLIKEKLTTAFTKLELFFRKEEFQALQQLVELCCAMQEIEDRPSIHKVRKKFEDLLKSVQPPIIKRKLIDEFNEEDGTENFPMKSPKKEQKIEKG